MLSYILQNISHLISEENDQNKNQFPFNLDSITIAY